MHRERLSFNLRGGNNDCPKRSATVSQVGYMRPEFKGGLTQAAVHQRHEKQGARPKQKKQQKERGGSDNQKRTKRDTCFN